MTASGRQQPLPYHLRLLEYLKSQEGALWEWFTSAGVRHEHFQAVKLQLLRSTYRIQRDDRPALYELAESAAQSLGQDLPLTLYQAQHAGDGLNAAFVWMPGEAHIVMHGPIAERLNEGELTAVFGHELAHAVLWSLEEGAYHVADRVLEAMANDQDGRPPHERSLQLFRLYTEAFCDRGALRAAADLEAAVSALVKIETGVTDVSAASFLRQADEVLEADTAATEEETHPETVIRARCLRLWSQQGEDAEEQIRAMIEGPTNLSRLDLLGQNRLTALTRELVAYLVQPAWMRSGQVVAHARLFFEDGQLPDARPTAPPAGLVQTNGDAELADYVCYVLLDFATCDVELQQAALARALLVARDVRVEERFLRVAADELKLRKRQVDALQKQAEKIVAEAEAGEDAS